MIRTIFLPVTHNIDAMQRAQFAADPKRYDQFQQKSAGARIEVEDELDAALNQGYQLMANHCITDVRGAFVCLILWKPGDADYHYDAETAAKESAFESALDGQEDRTLFNS